MHNKLVHQTSMVGIDDMAAYASVHFMTVRVTAKMISNQGVWACIQCTYMDHIHMQIHLDSESDGLDLESGESLHCPWLTRPAITHLQCNAMHYHTHSHTTPPALLQCLESRWMDHAILLTHTDLIHTHSFTVILIDPYLYH